VAGRAVAVNTRGVRPYEFDRLEDPWDTPSCFMIEHTVRAGRIVVGLVLLLLGIVLSLPLVPGPGLVLVVFGLGFLSHEFTWARRLRDRAHAEFDRVTRRRHV
jgi:hypothetical protein